jgi:hypothetical protein
VIAGYRKWLQQASKDMAQKGEMAGTIMYENFSSRLPVYDKAIREGIGHKSMLLKVGNVFAMYCGFENNLLVIS